MLRRRSRRVIARKPMSSHSLAIILSPEAQEDFEDIRVYTQREWGDQQETVYKAALLQALVTLSENPGLGRQRGDLGGELCSYVVRRHVIYYRLTEEALMVVRILHSRVDARRALGGVS